ncbi:MAG TPA: hypothetical protein VF062_03515 [Candidatus Limnocylindrales bacterium]
MSTRARVWWVVIVAWGLLLLGLGFWSALRDPATVREMSGIGAAKQVVDQVVGGVSGSVPPDWLFTDRGYREERCELTVARDGVSATRTLTLNGPPESESDALAKVASTVEGARLRPSGRPPESFYADAGTFVAVRGKITGPGSITVELTTGCRPPNS